MKVGIITAHWPHNYGAVLQTYALSKTLENLGHESEVIHFMTDFQEKHLHMYPPPSEMGLKGLLRSVRRLYQNACHYGEWKQRWQNFEDFKLEYLNISSKRYRTHDELLKNIPRYDAYICGSDQIWRSIKGSTTRFDPAYYLCFAKDTNGRRIAYAPSFGADYIPDELKTEYKKRILDIQFLSVRENQGRNIIKELTGREAKVVLDPTLLLPVSEWRRMMKEPSMDVPYILVYLVAGDRSEMGELIAQVKQKAKGHKVVALTSAAVTHRIANVDIVIPTAHPIEFLGWFSRASFVCTSSYHGMIFSLIFRKPFYAVMPQRISSRLTSLGQRLGLSSRLMTDKIEISENPFDCDFNQADQNYQFEKEASIQFLTNALGMRE